MNRLLTFVVALGLFSSFVSPLLAEEIEEFLPIGLTEEEKTRLHEIGMNFQRTAPPPGVMRTCAEWEHSERVLIRWPLGIPVSLVAEMSEDLLVVTIVGSASQQTTAISTYTSGGVNMANTQFIIAATNSIWTRDYGPWSIFDGNGNLGFIDHIYNRPRPQDDLIPGVVGAAWGIPVYAMPLTHTGGNHMSNANGMSSSEELVYDENPSLTPAQVDATMLDYTGNDYEVMDYVQTSGIHHIDCWAKFLNPNTILIKDVAPSDPDYSRLNARAAQWAAMSGPWGKPYKVVRIFCPSGTAYTNSIILNKKVFVPTFSNAWDDDAIQTYQNAMPGYEVLGFTGSWLSDDAIHCRAMGISDRNMMYVDHIPLETTGDTVNPYRVSAFVYAHSHSALLTDSLKVYYSVDGGAFASVALTATVDPDSFEAFIPAQAPGSEIRYYLKAADVTGNIGTSPYIGEPGSYTFGVNAAPTITSPDSYLQRTETAFSYYPEFSDPDDLTHTISYTGLPAWLTESNDSLSGTFPATPVSVQFDVTVADEFSSDTQTVTLNSYLCGDADGTGVISISDAVFLITHIFQGGPAPTPIAAGDADCNGFLSISDAVTLISYIFAGGPAPCASCP